jgi:nucleoside diphosphate kinase
VFIKPHALNDKVKALLVEKFKEKGLRVVKEGTLTAEQIDKERLIDQHYYAIASKATILKPSQLVIPNDKFKQTFGIDWQAALDSGKVYNAMDGCDFLGINADKLDQLWSNCKKNNKLVKLGGGFYCGLVEGVEGKPPVYIFNGFFMSMRSKFTAPGTAIHYYIVEWPASKLKWAEFRGDFLGKTDPAESGSDSLRGLLFTKWQEFGLAYQPNTGDNGVHASASPFEALAEKLNWIKADVNRDRFGKAILATGVSEDTIFDWSKDPQVTVPEEGQKSLFDSLEDLDAPECLAKIKAIAGK